jgi:hypothetical protein
MDPNVALAKAREAAAILLDADDDGNFTDPATTNLGQLIESFQALDEWLSKGGFKPRAWEVPAPREMLTHRRPRVDQSIVMYFKGCMVDEWVSLKQISFATDISQGALQASLTREPHSKVLHAAGIEYVPPSDDRPRGARRFR